MDYIQLLQQVIPTPGVRKSIQEQKFCTNHPSQSRWQLEMWANAQRDGRAAELNIGGALCSTPQFG